MEIPKHWTFIFEGMGENYNTAGEVITVADGEIIGTWSVLHGAFYTFTPNGATEIIDDQQPQDGYPARATSGGR